MRAERTGDEDHDSGARTRLVLALVAWIVVAAVTVGSLLYTSFGHLSG
jgi:hypothetical protein